MEKVLRAVLLFHDSAAESGLRKGTDSNALRGQLVARLQKVQFEEFAVLTDQKNWEAAFDLATRLLGSLPRSERSGRNRRSAGKACPSVAQRQGLRSYLQASLVHRGSVPQQQQGSEYGSHGAPQPGKTALDGCRRTREGRRYQGARARLTKARQMDYQLPGLQDFSLRLDKKNPVLYVGVHGLPEYFSPATAYLDSEKQAVELLSESLIKVSSSATIGPHYEPVLASDLPRMEPLGRQFSLVPQQHSSDGNRVTAADIRNTIELLSQWPGHVSEWAELLRGARIGSNSFDISLTLHQGYVDPLSLMDFKILPQGVPAADDPKFAKNPIGSGPYRLQTTPPGPPLGRGGGGGALQRSHFCGQSVLRGASRQERHSGRQERPTDHSRDPFHPIRKPSGRLEGNLDSSSISRPPFEPTG